MSTRKDLIARSDLELWLPQLKSYRFGLAKLERPLSMELYDQWIANGYHGEMSYLEKHRDFKADPNTWLPYAKSALVFAIDYVSTETAAVATRDYVTPGSSLRTALYTRFAPNQSDYHQAIRVELEPVMKELALRFPDGAFRLAVDAEPVLERDLAVRAGLGWVGKNTCVIDRGGGSLFFIAEILTSLETTDASLNDVDFCGTCTRCLDACPTNALIAPRKLDATKCISYWTIEAKTTPPLDLRRNFGDWFFGCDICQTVCPWNGKVFGRSKMQDEAAPRRGVEIREATERDLGAILESSNRELQRRFEGTPLARARGFGLKRNALIVAGNLKMTGLSPKIEKLLHDEKLGPLARETLDLIASQ